MKERIATVGRVSSNIPPLPTVPSRQSFFHQAATVSAFAPLFLVLLQLVSLGCFSSLSPDVARPAHEFFAVVIGLVLLGGIVLGIIALFGISRHGTKGLLVKALVGILVPVLLILAALPAVAEAHRMQQAAG